MQATPVARQSEVWPSNPPPPILTHPPGGLLPGDLLQRLKTAIADRYVIERELGHGGMATVYLARDLRHNRQVAVKVLRPELTVAVGAERFLREIEIAACLTHPHILRSTTRARRTGSCIT